MPLSLAHTALAKFPLMNKWFSLWENVTFIVTMPNSWDLTLTATRGILASSGDWCCSIYRAPTPKLTMVYHDGPWKQPPPHQQAFTTLTCQSIYPLEISHVRSTSHATTPSLAWLYDLTLSTFLAGLPANSRHLCTSTATVKPLSRHCLSTKRP